MINLASWCRLSPNIKVICVPFIWFTLVCVLCYRLFNVLLICCSYYEAICIISEILFAIMFSHFIVSKPFSLRSFSLSFCHYITLSNFSFTLFCKYSQFCLHFQFTSIQVYHYTWWNCNSYHIKAHYFCMNLQWRMNYHTNKYLLHRNGKNRQIRQNEYWSFECIIRFRDDIYFWETSHPNSIHSENLS